MMNVFNKLIMSEVSAEDQWKHEAEVSMIHKINCLWLLTDEPVKNLKPNRRFHLHRFGCLIILFMMFRK